MFAGCVKMGDCKVVMKDNEPFSPGFANAGFCIFELPVRIWLALGARFFFSFTGFLRLVSPVLYLNGISKRRGGCPPASGLGGGDPEAGG